MTTSGIITVNYYSTELINSLELLSNIYTSAQLYVVDNSGDFIPASVHTRVIRPGANLGFGRACNLAARQAVEDILLFINPDVITDAETIESLLSKPTDDLAAIWGPEIDDGKGIGSALRQSGNRLLPFERIEYRIPQAVESIYISGACMAVRADAFRSLGGFREDIFMYGEDLDLCLRAQAKGYQVSKRHDIVVRHIGGRSSSRWSSRFKRLFRSLNGHYKFLRTYYGPVTSIISAVYLASGRRSRAQSARRP